MAKSDTIPGEPGAGLFMGLLAATLTLVFLSRLFWQLPFPNELGQFHPVFVEHLKYWAAMRSHALIPFLNHMASEYAEYLGRIETVVNPAWITLRFDVALTCGIFLGIVVAWLIGKDRSAIWHIDGHRFFTGTEAARRIGRIAARAVKHGGIGIALHPSFNWCFTLSREVRHILVLGAIGGGKTQVITAILQSIIERGDYVIVYDFKGDYSTWLPESSLLAPWDARSCGWDIAEDCVNRQDARELAARLIPEGQDPLWHTAARQIVTAVLIKLQVERKTSWTWTDFYHLCCSSRESLLSYVEAYLPEARHTVESSEKTAQSILVNFGANVTLISNLAFAWGSVKKERKISFQKWLAQASGKGGKLNRVLVLQGNGGSPELAKATLQAMLNRISGLINSPNFGDSKTRRIWIVLDEFPTLGKMDAIAPLLEIGRSKGIRVVLGAQDLAQVKEEYGDNRASTWMGSIGTKVICQVNGGYTAKFISQDVIGYRKIDRTTYHKGERQPAIREVVPVVEIADLETTLGPDATGVNALLLGFGDVYKIHWPFTSPKLLREASLPAKWLTTQQLTPGNGTDYVPVVDGTSETSVPPSHPPSAEPRPKDSASLNSTAPTTPRLVLRQRNSIMEMATTGTTIGHAAEPLSDMTTEPHARAGVAHGDL